MHQKAINHVEGGEGILVLRRGHVDEGLEVLAQPAVLAVPDDADDVDGPRISCGGGLDANPLPHRALAGEEALRQRLVDEAHRRRSQVVARREVAPGDDGMATPLEALQQQLGLKLLPKKETAGIVVIEHIEKVPTEN